MYIPSPILSDIVPSHLFTRFWHDFVQAVRLSMRRREKDTRIRSFGLRWFLSPSRSSHSAIAIIRCVEMKCCIIEYVAKLSLISGNPSSVDHELLPYEIHFKRNVAMQRILDDDRTRQLSTEENICTLW